MVVVAPRVAVAAAVVVVGVKMAVAIAVAVGVSQEAGRGRKLHEAWFFLVLTPHWASPSLQHLRDRTDGSWQGTVHASLVNLVDVSLQYHARSGVVDVVVAEIAVVAPTVVVEVVVVAVVVAMVTVVAVTAIVVMLAAVVVLGAVVLVVIKMADFEVSSVDESASTHTLLNAPTPDPRKPVGHDATQSPR